MRALSVLLVAALAAMLPPPAVAAVAAAAAGPHAAGSPREPRGAWQQALATTLSWGPVGPPEPRGAWQQTLALLWNKSEGAAGFCIGGSRWRAEQLARESFPWPLPVAADGNDTVCSNRTRIEQHLCGPQEIEQYYKYMLLTENPEKVPDNRWCAAGSAGAQPACSPGFFDAARVGPEPVVPQQPQPCCPGFFCPAQLTCMMPCPLGAYCPRAWPAPPPDAYKGHGEAMWCAPYAYKQRGSLGCGGADQWRIVPGSAFPTSAWPAGSGSLYCQGGQYCPNTTAAIPCTRGHFCRQGTEFPPVSSTGVGADMLLFGLLALIVLVSREYNRLLQRLSARERIRITWAGGVAPTIAVVQAAPRSAQHSRSQSAAAETGGMRGRGLWGLLRHQRSAAQPSPGGVAARAAQVWAAWRGPQRGSSDEGNQPLLDAASGLDGPADDAHQDGAHTAPDAVELSPPPPPPPATNGAAGSGAAPGGRRLFVSHDRQLSVDEEALTPHHLHSRLLAPHRQALLSSRLGALSAGPAGARRPELDVRFVGLGLRLRSCGKTVLQSVSGRLRPSALTAIMGPSGAGKTSLLNTLAGKSAAYGVLSGRVLVNGVPDRLDRFKRVMGFVPQDDIMYSTLTVFETLLFSARFRLPATATRQQRLLAVERAITVLQLDGVRDSLIGDEETRGISGGQRKRVNVGIELVADPSLLFLDEPTSGLDSSASFALVEALHDISRSLKVTAAAVVHQPSWPCCQLFDDLLLLGAGGRTVYCGPVAGAAPYFEGLGYALPLHQNPADAFLDICSGAVLRAGQASASQLFADWEQHCQRQQGDDHDAHHPGHAALLVPGQPAGSEELGELEGGAPSGGPAAAATLDGELLGDEVELRSWRRRLREAALFGGAYVAAGVAHAWCSLRAALPRLGSGGWGRRLFGGRQRSAAAGDEDELHGGTHKGAARVRVRRTTPGFLPQLWWVLSRAAVKRMREPLSIFTDVAIFALTGLTLGLISDRGRATILHFAVDITYSVVALGLLSTVGALPTFGRDRVVFFREAAAGLNRAAYFLAHDTFDHGGTLLRASVFYWIYWSFAAPRAVVWQMLLVSVGITYSCTGVAYVLSQLLEPSAAQLSAAVLALINTLIARQGHARGLLWAVQQFTFARWGLEGYTIAESGKLTGVWLLARCAELQSLEYDVRRFGACLAALFGLGLLFRALALLAMLTLHRDKQR